MRRFVCAIALIAVAGCGSDAIPPPRPVPRVDWSLTSSDGRFQVEQRHEGSACRVEARVLPGRRLWTSRSCVPAGALAFLSPDGRRMLVLDVAAGQGGELSSATLVSLWVDGAVLREYRGAELLGPGAARAPSASWVRGSSPQDLRDAARASPEGETVQIDLADGRTVGLGFGGEALRSSPGAIAAATPTRPAAPRAPATPAPAQPGAAPLPPTAAHVEPAPPRAAAGAVHHRPSRPPPAPAQRAPAPPPAAAVAQRAPAPPPARDAPVPDRLSHDEVGLYRWEDDQGGLHFGSGSQIPQKYRRRAVPISTSVGVMPTDRQPEPPPTAPSGAAAVPPAGATAPAAEKAAGPAASPAGEAPAKKAD